MSSEWRGAACFALAAFATYLVTPVAIRAAVRLSFFDVPAGYKGHRRPTPYLGGSAIMLGVLVSALAFSSSAARPWALLGGAALLWGVGTLDDRVNLPMLLRVAVEVGIGVWLWVAGEGWHVFHASGANLFLTVVWVVGVLNAFNLMDNMDGAAATTAAVSALGVGTLALISGKSLLAPLCFALAGACCGFLPGNLTRPARIFMGDGGSLPVGLLVAGLTMSVVTRDYFGPRGVVIGALLVGLVILDTTLVTYSRARGRRPVLTGGRDHLTHRLVELLGSPRAVVLALAMAQLALCAATIAVARAGFGWVLLAGGIGIAFGVALIWQLERSAGSERAAVHASTIAFEPATSASAASVHGPADALVERVTA